MIEEKNIPNEKDIKKLHDILDNADAVLIGAGAGLSTAAGFTYSGQRFHRYFDDFSHKYGIQDMYSGGFYPFPSANETWAWWSRHIWINRYIPNQNDTYYLLRQLLGDKKYFVLTTNVDHCFIRAGFPKDRIFYTQGDYGLFQCSVPCRQETYDNEILVREMLLSQGFKIENDGSLLVPELSELKMTVPDRLIPRCPNCGAQMTMNLRSDDSFVEDSGWNKAAARYGEFLSNTIQAGKKTLLMELGVGRNTPGIIKYPFWQMAAKYSNVQYACLNLESVVVPEPIMERGMILEGDLAKIIKMLYRN